MWYLGYLYYALGFALAPLVLYVSVTDDDNTTSHVLHTLL